MHNVSESLYIKPEIKPGRRPHDTGSGLDNGLLSPYLASPNTISKWSLL